MSAVILCDDEVLELGEMLEFLADWIDAHHDTLGDDLDRFAGGRYDLVELREDIVRFVFLLGGPAERFINGNQP